MLEATIRKYQNRTIEAAQVIAELIELAKQMREGHKRGDKNTQAVFGDLGGVPNTCEFGSFYETFARANCSPKPATS
jgi:hypothetical protein